MTKHTLNCKECRNSIDGELYHLGFSNLEAIYCDSCPNVLLLRLPGFYSDNGIEMPSLQAGDEGWGFYDRHLFPYYEKAESHFPSCSCGGCFRFMAAPRCPVCKQYLMGKGFANPIDRNMRHVFVCAESFEV